VEDFKFGFVQQHRPSLKERDKRVRLFVEIKRFFEYKRRSLGTLYWAKSKYRDDKL
jgi:hypothetical protein